MWRKISNGEAWPASTVAIKLRYSDFTTLTRQMTLAVPTDDAIEIYRRGPDPAESAPGSLAGRCGCLGVGAHQLAEPTGQLPLFDLGASKLACRGRSCTCPSESRATDIAPATCQGLVA